MRHTAKFSKITKISNHTVNFCSEMGQAIYVSGKNTFCSLNVEITRGKRIFEIVHWPFKLPPNQHWPAGPSGWIYQCMSARPSKGQCRNSKIFLPLILVIKVVQNTFFPETYNASTFLSLDSRCDLLREVFQKCADQIEVISILNST